jgi:hypothetical protein
MLIKFLASAMSIFFSVASYGQSNQPAQPPEKSAKEQLDTATAELRIVQDRFNARLVLVPEYVDAKKQLEAATAKVESAQDSDRLKAVTDKLQAQIALDAIVKKLQEANADITNANRNIQEAKQKVQAELDGQQQVAAAEGARRRQEWEQKRTDYKAIVASKMAETAPDYDRESIPLIGDETNLVLVKAKPQNYVDKPFFICGIVRSGNGFLFAYTDAKPTHYCLYFDSLNSKGQRGQDCSLFARRNMGDDIIKILAKLDEQKVHLLMRFKVTISSHYVKTFDDAADQYEVLDWKFYDGTNKKWGPWHSEAGQ